LIKEKLDRIRAPRGISGGRTAAGMAGAFVLGAVLGVFAKWLDALALDDAIRWHRWIEALDLGNFFSDLAVWLLAALLLAVFSASALRAAGNVFVFFTGMCVAYHLYSVVFGGFNPASYMRIWYAITLVSPVLAALCWYARGTGAAALVLDVGILACFWVACFAIGFLYVDCRGILYLLTFIGAAAALYRSPKQLALTLAAGFLLALLISPLWPQL
jgi:hypothetical protein